MTRHFRASALLFDCDGVLVDSYDAAAAAWNQWAVRWKPGFDFHRDIEHERRLADYVTELVGPVDAPQAIAELIELESRATDTREIPGAAALLVRLPVGTWAVVTSATRDIAAARLAAAGIASPPVLITADDVPIGKPAPDPYLAAAAQLGRPPSECVVFEDAPAGVVAAHRAGVTAIIGVGGHATGPPVSATVTDLRDIQYDGSTLTLPPNWTCFEADFVHDHAVTAVREHPRAPLMVRPPATYVAAEFSPIVGI